MTAKAESKYLVVVSLDGLSAEDFPVIQRLPHFKRLLESGACIRRLEGIYPTQTYPLHTTIVTGCYPHKHGIASNTRLEPSRWPPNWHWYRKDIHVPTLYDVATTRGFPSATLFWPVAGGAKIRSVLPEIKAIKPWQCQLLLMLRAGSPLFMLAKLLRFGRYLKKLNSHYLDDMTSEIACHLIRRRHIRLLLLHLLDLDYTRHRHGFMGGEVDRVLEEQDRRLGRVMKASEQAGTSDETALVVIGDHAFKDVQQRINIGATLRRAGLIHLGPGGRVKSWHAWANTCDGSAHIRLRDRSNSAMYRKVMMLLSALEKDAASGVAAVFDRDAIAAMRVGRHIDFILEAKPGYYFSSDLDGEAVGPAEEGHRASHGYLPDREGYASFLLASGSGIRRGVQLEEAKIVDVGPTLASLLVLA
jgi:predicted AlkP superfamily pyrophosphatase or phosphodiesterase